MGVGFGLTTRHWGAPRRTTVSGATSAGLACSIEHPCGIPEKRLKFLFAPSQARPLGIVLIPACRRGVSLVGSGLNEITFLGALEGPIWRTSRSGEGSHGSRMALF